MHNKISFITNVGINNLEYLKLLLKSLKENLHYTHHEIIVFIDRDNEGIYEYLKSIKSDFYDLKIVTHKFPTNYVGYQLNINILVELAKYDIVSYLQSDMVISKNYDLNILEDLEDKCILSATRIEPPLHPTSDKTFTMNFGDSPSNFKFEEFVKYSEEVKSNKVITYFFAPFTFYKKYWQQVGGHDSIFRRSREDSDILQKFLHADIKIKQTFKANVYHFTCVSSRGNDWFNTNNIQAKKKVELQQTADWIELKKFIRNWGGFNHGEEKLIKYDVHLQVQNSKNFDLELLQNIEPYFSKVWVDDTNQRNSIVEKLTEYEDTVPNELCEISKNDWDITKKYYNTTDYNSIFVCGTPINYKCLIIVNSTASFNASHLLEIVKNLNAVIENYEIGDYDYNGIKIIIKEKCKISNLISKNPNIETGLIQIE